MTSISDTNVVNAPGGLVELGQNSTDRTNVAVTGTSTSNATELVATTIVCDESPIIIEFQCGMSVTNGEYLSFGVWIDGVYTTTFEGSLAVAGRSPISAWSRLVPTAGAKTISIRWWKWSGSTSTSYIEGMCRVRVSKIIQASQLIVQTPNAPLVTSLPSNAIDGQEVRYLADNTNGIIWNFRYRAGSSSAYKWEFIGGSQLSSTVSTFQQLAAGSGVWSDLATVGPAVTIPLAGDYSIHANAQMYNNFAGAARGFYGISLNGAAPFVYVGEDIAAQGHYAGGGINYTSSGLSAGASLKQLYQQINVGVQFGYRYIGITPIRVSA